MFDRKIQRCKEKIELNDQRILELDERILTEVNPTKKTYLSQKQKAISDNSEYNRNKSIYNELRRDYPDFNEVVEELLENGSRSDILVEELSKVTSGRSMNSLLIPKIHDHFRKILNPSSKATRQVTVIENASVTITKDSEE